MEIDHDHDLALASCPGRRARPRVQLDVDVVITDFDGVHTDDSALVNEDGHETVRVSRSDGLGIERLRKAGVPLLILSKETNRVVRARAAKLGVEVLHGIEAQAEVVRDWLKSAGGRPGARRIPRQRHQRSGPMGLVGWPIAVADAHPEVRRAARLVLSRPAVRGRYGSCATWCLETRGPPRLDPAPQRRRHRQPEPTTRLRPAASH